MSLLSDLLSKIRQPQPKKDVPPNLKSIFISAKKTEMKQKKIAFLIIVLLVFVGSGILAIYVFDRLSEDERQKRLLIAKRAEREAAESKEVVKPGIKELKNGEQDNKNRENISKDDRAEKPTMVEASTKSDAAQKASSQNDNLKRKTPEPSAKKREDVGTSEVIAAKKDAPVSESKTTIKPEITKPDTSEKDLYLYQARDFESKGRLYEAMESYKKVLNIEAKNYRVMNNIASILIRLKSYKEAAAYLRAAVELKNDYVPALINIAVALASDGEYQEPERFLLKALTLEPYNREALFNIGVLYERQGNTDKAREYFIKLKQTGDKRGEAAIERLK